MWGNDADYALNKNGGPGANPKSGTGLSQDCPFILSVRTVFSLERSFSVLAFLARTQRFSQSSHTQSNGTALGSATATKPTADLEALIAAATKDLADYQD